MSHADQLGVGMSAMIRRPARGRIILLGAGALGDGGLVLLSPKSSIWQLPKLLPGNTFILVKATI